MSNLELILTMFDVPPGSKSHLYMVEAVAAAAEAENYVSMTSIYIKVGTKLNADYRAIERGCRLVAHKISMQSDSQLAKRLFPPVFSYRVAPTVRYLATMSNEELGKVVHTHRE